MSDVDLVYKATLDGSGFNSGASGIISQLGMMGSAAGVATAAFVALAAVVAGIGAVVIGSVKVFSDFQQSAADLNKIMGGTADQQKTIADNMRQMSLESGTAVTNLLGVAASLSAMGIETENLTSATKVIDQMGIALGLSNDEASSYMAGLNTLYGTSVDKWSNIASGINDVENSTSATSKGMLNFANEFAPLAKQFDVTDKQALALGATFEALKVPPEEAATSLRSAFNVASSDPKKMTAWADLLGISVKDLTNSLDKDFIGTMLKSGAEIDKIQSASEKAATTNEIWGTYGMKSISLLGDQTATYTENLETLNKGYEENTSLSKEVETRNNTLLGSWNKAKAAINDLGITIGETTQGPIKGLLDGFVGMYPAIQQGVQSLLSGDFSGLGDVVTKIGSSISNYFKSLDYKEIGFKLRDALISAWDFAVGLFKSAMGAGDSLVGVFSALGDILRPTFEHIFSSLQIAGLKAALAVGEAMTTLANTIGQALTTAINWVLDRLADLADSIDSVTGGAIGKLYGGGGAGSSSSKYSMQDLVEHTAGGMKYYTFQTPGGTVNFPANDLKAIQGNLDLGYKPLSMGNEETSTFKTRSTDMPEGFSPLPEGTTVIGIWGGEAPASDKPPSAEEIAMHERGTDTLANLMSESNDIQGLAGDAIRALKSEYVDHPPFAASDKGKLIQSQIDLLESQKAQAELLKKSGLEETKAAKDLEQSIKSTGEKVASDIVAAVTGQPAEGPGMYSGTSGPATDWRSYYTPSTGGYAGPTEYYDEFVQWKALKELGAIEAERNVVAINEAVAAYEAGNITLDVALEKIRGMGSEAQTLQETASKTDFAEANSGAKELESTCVTVEHSMENISHQANALRDGIFETGNTRTQTSARTIATPQVATTQQSSSASNAQIASQTRYLAQIANGVTTLRANLVTTGNRLYAGLNTAATAVQNGINPTINGVTAAINAASSAITGAIASAAASIVAAVEKSKGGGGGISFGPHGGSDTPGSAFYGGLAGSGSSYSTGYIYGFSKGGYASNPTLAMVGDSPGGEYMVPAQRLDEFVTGYMNRKQTHLDAGNMQSQLFDAVSSLNIPAIRLPITIDIDSEAIYEAVEYAIRNISSDIKLRARI